MRKRTSGIDWAFRDLLIALVIVYMAMSCLAVMANVTTKVVRQTHVGDLTFEMQWPVGSPSDMDMWVKAPDDLPVGYARKNGTVCDLLRDDTGVGYTKNSRALEIVACHGKPAGEYIVNVHAFALREDPIEVKVFVTTTSKGNVITLNTANVAIKHSGDEITAVRFKLDDKGELVPGSINDVQIPLRSSGG